MNAGTLIVGAALAGLRTAEQLRARGYDGRLTLVGAERHLPYDRPPLSKQMLLGEWPESQIYLVTEGRLAELRIDLRLGVPATALDRGRKLVTLADGTRLSYDSLVIATGSRARAVAGRGVGCHDVHTLRTLDDARQIAAKLKPGRRLLVIGGGFIGCEVASSAVARGAFVTLVAREPVLMPHLGPRVSDRLMAMHRDAGVELVLGADVQSIGQTAGGATSTVLTDGRVFDADLVVAGIGGIPNVEWLEGTGLAGPEGVRVSHHGRTVDEVIFAVGDVSAWPCDGDPGFRRSEHWSYAVEQSKIVARALVDGMAAEPLAFVPYGWSDQHNRKIQIVGEVSSAMREVVSANWETSDRRCYCLYLDGRGSVAGGFFLDNARAAGQFRRELQRQGGPVALDSLGFLPDLPVFPVFPAPAAAPVLGATGC
ncbi:NAD(P)/FAD-dependent oxidoreductase [Micromonospora sp. NPDC048830]|uniref:NAD(P)/FAD-dependent oxidoreductase n=1 Tax=Micromonospora sp. NPDC048830 TaxID=3364257 RepID=UPI0037136623